MMFQMLQFSSEEILFDKMNAEKKQNINPSLFAGCDIVH